MEPPIPSPPVWARVLLRIGLAGDTREVISGDLQEEYRLVVAGRGAAAARRWYWRQAMRSLAACWRWRKPRAAWASSASRRERRVGRERSRVRMLIGGFAIHALAQDIRYAWRTLRTRRAFSAAAVCTLALGIGGASAVFGLAQRVLLSPMPGIREPDRVVTVLFAAFSDRGYSPRAVSYLNRIDLAAGAPALSGLAGYQRTSVDVAAAEASARRVTAEFVQADYFNILGVQPAVGRTFVPADDREEHAISGVVISDALWATLFDRSDRVIGSTMRINGRIAPVLGVLADDFHGMERVGETEVWIPGAALPFARHFGDVEMLDDRDRGVFFWFVSRLAPDATVDQAQQQLETALRGLATVYPEARERFNQAGPLVSEHTGIRPLMRGRVYDLMAVLSGVVGLVLLLACANVANLLLIEGVRRQREIAVRRALGGSAGRIVRQHLTESVMLATVGGVLGVGLAVGLVRTFTGTDISGVGAIDSVPIDWRVLLFALSSALATGVAFGIVPAVLAARWDLSGALRDSTRSDTGRRTYLRSALSVVQLGGATSLLVGALLLVGTLRHLTRIELGFDAQNVTTFFVSPEDQGYTSDDGLVYYRDLMREIRSVPGVQAVAVSRHVPFNMISSGLIVFDPTNPADSVSILSNPVSAEYFDVLGIEVRGGRPLTENEAFGSDARPPAIVSSSMARLLFGDRNPVGMTFTTPRYRQADQVYRVVGVVGEVQWTSLVDDPEPFMYVPIGAMPTRVGEATVSVRTTPGVEGIGLQLGDVAARLNAAMPIQRVEALSEKVKRWSSERQLLARVLTLLSAVAVALAAVGLYAVVAFSVTERTREFGVRIALGAAPGRVMTLVMRQTTIIAGLGTVLGLVGAVALARWLESQLFGVRAVELGLYATAVLSLVAVAVLAGLVPARSATRVDPAEALRHE